MCEAMKEKEEIVFLPKILYVATNGEEEKISFPPRNFEEISFPPRNVEEISFPPRHVPTNRRRE